MQLRTIEGTHKALLERDKDCALTLSALRRFVVSGEIPSKRVGRKYLVDFDKIDDYLEALTSTPAQAQETTINGIRRINK